MGWNMVCRDGVPRHQFPYHNKGDAEFDAGYCDEKNEPCGPGCVGGPHVVAPTSMECCDLAVERQEPEA